ncbi:MAG: FtsX-like permease family protein [Rhodobacterales bacterium]|nr:FtsX-like permease family protein [Rhodobacterales bacterium]
MNLGPSMAGVAWRNLWRNKRRTLLTLTAIAFGMFLAILMTAMQDQSFADMIDTAARMGGGHVTVQHPEYIDTPTLTRTVEHAGEVIEIAERNPLVEKGVPRISGQAMIATAKASYGAYFVAYDPSLENDQTLRFLEGVVDGEMLAQDSGNGVVIGKKLAANLGVGLGDKVVYTLIDKHGEIIGSLGRVRGIIGTGAASMDAALLMLPIDHLREQLGYAPDEVTQVALFLNDSRKSATVTAHLKPQLLNHGDALTWYEVSPELSGFIAMKVGGARFMELVVLILVAASIFNTLFVSVIERTREFGIQLAIGYSPLQIAAMVIWESFWLALCGVLAGGLVSYGPYKALAANGIDISAQLGDNPVEVAGVGMNTVLSVGISPENVYIIVGAVVLSTLLAGLYPAWRAGRVQPVEAIKLV